MSILVATSVTALLMIACIKEYPYFSADNCDYRPCDGNHAAENKTGTLHTHAINVEQQIFVVKGLRK
jgi:hypothetical protein